MVQHQERLNLQHGTYVGDVSNGKPHGNGTMEFKADDAAERKTYQGSWVNGRREGHGSMTWRNGEVNTALLSKWICNLLSTKRGQGLLESRF